MRCIEIYDGDRLVVHDELPSSIEAALQSITRRFWQKCRIYAEDGTVWRIEPTRLSALSFLTRVLVETGFYNPQRRISVSCHPVSQYILSDLKEIMWGCLYTMVGDPPLDKDGSDLVGKIGGRLTGAQSFDEIVRTLREFRVTSGR